MSNYHWVITRDLLNLGDVGTFGPSGASLDADAIRRHEQAQPFQLKDDDGELVYEGVYVGPQDETLFAPLDDFGLPNAGCTEILYRAESGAWEGL
jgi:hypothetical protein